LSVIRIFKALSDSRVTQISEIETQNLVGRFIVASPSPRTTNHPWKGRGQVAWPIYIFGRSNHKLISGAAEARVVKFCTEIGYAVLTLRRQRNGCGQYHV